jgi:hypothetical protein
MAVRDVRGRPPRTAAASALAVGRQREVRRGVVGLELEEEVQRRGERVVGSRERGVRVGERVAVAHGGGDEVATASWLSSLEPWQPMARTTRSAKGRTHGPRE